MHTDGDINKFIDELGTEERPFGESEEEAIISVALELPDFYKTVSKYIEHDYFRKFNTRFVAALIHSNLEKNGTIPPRDLLKDEALKSLSTEDDWESVVNLIDRKPTPREIPVIKNRVIKWARAQAFALLYDEKGLTAFENEDFDELEKIFEQAKRITDTTRRGVWFFKDIESLFSEVVEIKLTTGYSKLDKHINMGGPTKKDVFCWMAPTGVGKSIMLVNSGLACLKHGLNVMHITCEMSAFKTQLRYAGVLTDVKIKDRLKRKKIIREKINKFASTYEGKLYIEEYPPDEISVDNIYQSLDNLVNQENWAPDVIIIDYLELMISRNKVDNKDDYTKQKRVATQVRGLAKNANVLIFTATQTNRESKGRAKRTNTPLPLIPIEQPNLMVR